MFNGWLAGFRLVHQEMPSAIRIQELGMSAGIWRRDYKPEAPDISYYQYIAVTRLQFSRKAARVERLAHKRLPAGSGFGLRQKKTNNKQSLLKTCL